MGDETGAPPTRPKEMSLGELVSRVVSYNVQWRRWVYENKDVDEWTFKRKLREFAERERTRRQRGRLRVSRIRQRSCRHIPFVPAPYAGKAPE